MNIENITKYSFNNVEELNLNEKCGCYFCIRTFPVTEITDFADNGKTALCPNCDIDAILPGVISTEFLEAACEKWFTGESKMNEKSWIGDR